MSVADYRWVVDWSGDEQSSAMAHTGVVALNRDEIITGAPAQADLIFSDSEGIETRRLPVGGLVELHGLRAVVEHGEDLIWICDPGFKAFVGAPELQIRWSVGRVVQIDLSGRHRRELPAPADSASDHATYAPTAIAIDETRFKGTGELWVADGYGAEVVRRYSEGGDLLGILTGDEGAGRFSEPHDVFIDRRRSVAEVYVADRRNGRIQVYGLAGDFRRLVGEDVLAGPAQLATVGENLAVADALAGRVTMFDSADRFVGHLFPCPDAPSRWDDLPDGWPNRRSPAGDLVRADLRSGSFTCPHGLAATADGSLIVSEYAAGGRMSVLSHHP